MCLRAIVLDRTSKKFVESPPKNYPVGSGKERVVATCSESGSNPSSRVLYLRLHLLPLEPLVDAILVVQLYPARKATAPSTWHHIHTP
jgi:hypothetical protein